MIPDAHIYIIEDDETMVGLLKTLLEMEGCQVSTYRHLQGLSIPNLINEIKPSLILMDVNLRELNGLEVLQEIKADPQVSAVKVIMSSGSDYKNLCLKFGADRFLLKPYMPDDLIEMISEVLAETEQK
jgi:DNA-binding response OmpR family regulator